MDNPTETQRFRCPAETKTYLALLGIFYFFFLLLTPLGTDISFVPPSLEPRGVYHVLKIDAGDDAGYFAYLRSMFIDHDVDFFNELYYAHRNRINDTGYAFNQWNIGPAVLWLPFFIAAHGITKFYKVLGVPLAQDGLSFVYFSSTALASATFVYCGLVLHFIILRQWFSRRAAFWSVTLFFLATPLVYFTFIRSRMAHADDYFLCCLFILIWLRFRAAPSATKSVLLGLAGGLMILTRINSACLLLLPLYDVCDRFYKGFKGKETADWTYLLYFFYSLCFCAVVYSIQVGVNSVLSGEASGDARSGAVLATIFSPEALVRLFTNPFKILWGANWGLFWHAPVYIVGACGLFFFVKKNKSIGLPLAISLSIPVFLVLVWPHHGISYGNRHLLTTNVVLSFGAAFCYDQFRDRIKPVYLNTVSGLLIFWSYLQLCFFKILVPYESSQFVLTVVQSLRILLDIPGLLNRGENFFYMILHPDFAITTALDQYLLIWFPLAQLLTPIILLFTGVYIWDRMGRYPEFKRRLITPVMIIATLFFIGLNVTIQTVNDQKSPEFIAKRKAEAVGGALGSMDPQARAESQ
ncbi:MAG: hypothetical protein VYC17_01480 [Nitrospinota bacterium]|nr:hypothetical protein [Nitrospinota bacterium]